MKFSNIAGIIAVFAAALVAAAPVPDDDAAVNAVLGYKRSADGEDLGYKRDIAVEVAPVQKDKRHCAAPLKKN
ncbi:hypothetical protein Daus18300_000514 [Diaporthe australafricana]|uniref:Uncharacterized protein n=1 Tax=Diaporthe australafricana TaxID=127596 RepID=A0ABR3Y3J1_9PEZI